MSKKKFSSTKVIPLGSCAFRQPFATSHCRYIHGYRLQAKFWFSCNVLDSNNWVVDFGVLKELKNLLECKFDHTTCISENDPELNIFKALHEKQIIDLRILPGVGIEKFAELCLDIANKHIKEISHNRCWVEKVEVWEHEQNSAICEADQYAPGEVARTNIFDVIAKQHEEIYSSTNHDELDAAAITKINEQKLAPIIPIPPAQNIDTIVPPLNAKVTKGISDPFAGTSWSKSGKRG
jgi:6-pyruvoyltetrahydropterin/6-carboxytetrahydropterin synthase